MNENQYVYEDEKVINGFFGENRFLSNFALADVSLNGITFPSVEVAYQAAKCQRADEFKKFSAYGSAEAKRVGKLVQMRPDWNDIKLNIMTLLVEQKFHRNPQLLARLLKTGEKQLIEANAWRDRYWGVYYRFYPENDKWFCHGGENNLGIIIMKVRDKLLKD